jgi:outer membrane protein TolC
MRASVFLYSLTIFGFGVAFPSAVRATEDGPLTLESLMESAKRHHPSLKKEPLLVESLELQRSRLNRAYFPQLSLGGRMSWQSEVTEVDVQVPGVTVTSPPKSQYQATLDLQQIIWDGGVISDQKRLAESKSKVEQEKVNLQWYQVRGVVLQLYFGGLVQHELKAQADALHTYVGTLIEKTEVLVEQGLAIERDVLLLKARQFEAKQASVDAAKSLEGIRRHLEELTGLVMKMSVEFAPPTMSCSGGANKRLALDSVRRPELDVLTAEAEVLDASEKASRAADRPKLGAFTTVGYARPGLNYLSDQFNFMFIGGIQLTVPLTYLYAGTHQKGDNQVALQRSLLARQKDAILVQVNVEHKAQSTELSRLDEVIELDEELLQVREQARAQTEMRIELGTAATADLVDDLTQEDQARSRRAVHHAQRNLACHELAFIKGDL